MSFSVNQHPYKNPFAALDVGESSEDELDLEELADDILSDQGGVQTPQAEESTADALIADIFKGCAESIRQELLNTDIGLRCYSNVDQFQVPSPAIWALKTKKISLPKSIKESPTDSRTRMGAAYENFFKNFQAFGRTRGPESSSTGLDLLQNEISELSKKNGEMFALNDEAVMRGGEVSLDEVAVQRHMKTRLALFYYQAVAYYNTHVGGVTADLSRGNTRYVMDTGFDRFEAAHHALLPEISEQVKLGLLTRIEQQLKCLESRENFENLIKPQNTEAFIQEFKELFLLATALGVNGGDTFLRAYQTVFHDGQGMDSSCAQESKRSGLQAISGELYLNEPLLDKQNPFYFLLQSTLVEDQGVNRIDDALELTYGGRRDAVNLLNEVSKGIKTPYEAVMELSRAMRGVTSSIESELRELSVACVELNQEMERIRGLEEDLLTVEGKAKTLTLLEKVNEVHSVAMERLQTVCESFEKVAFNKDARTGKFDSVTSGIFQEGVIPGDAKRRLYLGRTRVSTDLHTHALTPMRKQLNGLGDALKLSQYRGGKRNGRDIVASSHLEGLRALAETDPEGVNGLFFNSQDLLAAQESIQETGAVSGRLSHTAFLEKSGISRFESEIVAITDMKTINKLQRDETGAVKRGYAMKLARQQRALWAKTLDLSFHT